MYCLLACIVTLSIVDCSGLFSYFSSRLLLGKIGAVGSGGGVYGAVVLAQASIRSLQTLMFLCVLEQDVPRVIGGHVAIAACMGRSDNGYIVWYQYVDTLLWLNGWSLLHLRTASHVERFSQAPP